MANLNSLARSPISLALFRLTRQPSNLVSSNTMFSRTFLFTRRSLSTTYTFSRALTTSSRPLQLGPLISAPIQIASGPLFATSKTLSTSTSSFSTPEKSSISRMMEWQAASSNRIVTFDKARRGTDHEPTWVCECSFEDFNTEEFGDVFSSETAEAPTYKAAKHA